MSAGLPRARAAALQRFKPAGVVEVIETGTERRPGGHVAATARWCTQRERHRWRGHTLGGRGPLPLYRHCPCRLSSPPPRSAGVGAIRTDPSMAVDPSISAPVVAVLEEARQLDSSDLGQSRRHLEHAAGFAQAFGRVPGPGSGPYLDLGSGGGLPGLVLGDLWPDCRFHPGRRR